MTIKEAYAAFGGDYDDVVSRMMTEKLVTKFVLKFLNDKSYEMLCESLSNEDYDTAFRAAHTLKGVCQNLSFTKLFESSNNLTESLRGNEHPPKNVLDEMLAEVKKDYDVTVSVIKEFSESVAQ